MRYVTRRRIERAQDLLRSANLTITEVCMLVGFSSLGSFSSRFREVVGQSPTEYRDEAVARSGAPPIPGCFVLLWTRPHPGTPRPADAQSGRSAEVGGAATVAAQSHF